MLRTIDIDLTYQPLIDGPPNGAGDLHNRSCQGDKVTMDTWRDIWIKNYKAAKDHFGNFADKSIAKLYKSNLYGPAIVIGSGPSLKHSIKALKSNKESIHPIKTVSCLHNFGYFEDEGCHADYYLSVDSGGIVIEDLSESRTHDAQYYWDKTKDHILIGCTASDPKLFEKWKGEIYLFSCLIPDDHIREQFNKIERFAHYISTGGNALGGCMYFAKAVLGSDVIHYVGADFCFDYDNTFHAYKTHYDDLGKCVPWCDVFGNLRKTWVSYLNFKFWLDHVACKVPGRWINCSEGLLGAYREGNIRQFQYMTLDQALIPFQMNERVFLEQRDIRTNEVKDKFEIKLNELFENPQYEKDIVMF